MGVGNSDIAIFPSTYSCIYLNTLGFSMFLTVNDWIRMEYLTKIKFRDFLRELPNISQSFGKFPDITLFSREMEINNKKINIIVNLKKKKNSRLAQDLNPVSSSAC